MFLKVYENGDVCFHFLLPCLFFSVLVIHCLPVSILTECIVCASLFGEVLMVLTKNMHVESNKFAF